MLPTREKVSFDPIVVFRAEHYLPHGVPTTRKIKAVNLSRWTSLHL
jgi:Xaa-Pro aminopeptidase